MKVNLENILLRAMEPSDIDFLMETENNVANWEVSSNNLPFSRDALLRYIDHAHQDLFEAGQFRFVIDYKKKAIGFVDVFDVESTDLKAGVGIYVADPFRKLGVANKAIRLLQEIAKIQWNLNQLYAHVGDNNSKSLRLFEECGFQKAGFLKSWKMQSGSFVDFHLLQWMAHEN